ncbi:MAG: NAD-dependent epimerase/dehydratase family protein [Flavitalea sp.]
MVVVTGGTGFLGAYIIRELVEKGYRVRALKRSSTIPSFIEPAIFSSVEWVDGDILDTISLEEAFEGAEAVIHSAAIVSYHSKDKEELYKVNVEGTANVVNLALEANIKRLVFVSSIASIGRSKEGDKVDEDRKWEDNNTNSHYAISKQMAEREVWRGIAEGMEAVIINPSTILGYGDWNKSSSAIFKSVYNQFPYYSNGINGFVDVEDVAKATVLLMESEISGKRFIASSENWSFKQLFYTIADSFNKKRPTIEATPFLSGLAWRLEKIKSLFGKKILLTKESAKLANSTTYFDNSRILDALPGFQFTPLTTTIERACKKYMGNNPGR